MPTPFKMTWFETLSSAKSVADLRKAMAERQPAFALAALKRLVIVGAADEGRRFAETCRERNIEVAAICDADPAKLGQSVAGGKVEGLERLQQLDKSLPVVIASHRVLKALGSVKKAGFTKIAPLGLLQILYPETFRPHMFYDGLLEDLIESRAEYAKFAEALADDKSRATLDALLGYRLSMNAEVLEPVLDHDLYAPAGVIAWGEHEVYIEGGAFDGDTIRMFIERVRGKFDRVLAFEPDAKTFVRLRENFRNEPRVEPINKGVFSSTTTLCFDNAGTRGSIFGGDEGFKVPVTTIDEVLGERPVTYIKLNIEGAELDALDGAKQAIRRHRPRLAVSVYHRPGDLWNIAVKVRELEPSYRFYLRQHDGGIIESVLYAVAGK